MQCVTPMFRVYELGNHSKGIIIPRSEVLERLNFDSNYIRHQMKLYKQKHPKKGLETVPCQHCYACSINYSAEWATRIMLEAQKYENNFWITLTYDQDHLPIAENIKYGEKTYENVGDEIWCTGCLVPEDINSNSYFMKSLRKYFERELNHKGIKTYYCGEYGTEGLRPHYHLVLLNCPLDITQFYDTHIDDNFKAHWKSHQLEQWWDKGIVDICELEWSDAAYTARYCAKKIFKKTTDEQYCEIGKIPEFVGMSKGIATDYFKENMDEIYKNDGFAAKTVKGNICKVKPPRYFDKKFKELHPEEFKLIQQSRRHQQERAEKLLHELTDIDDKTKMIRDAEKIKMKMDMLPRGGDF